MHKSIRAIIFITLVLLPNSIHQDEGLRVGVGVPVQVSDN